MEITSAKAADFDCLTEIWEASVRATHFFLSESDIRDLRSKVREEYLALPGMELLKAGLNNEAAAFMGIFPSADGPANIAMLFVAPEAQGRGLGRALIGWAAEKFGALELDVNEQNPGARVFYEKMGFVQTGRSPVDGEGRPFPLLHMFKASSRTKGDKK